MSHVFDTMGMLYCLVFIFEIKSDNVVPQLLVIKFVYVIIVSLT